MGVFACIFSIEQLFVSVYRTPKPRTTSITTTEGLIIGAVIFLGGMAVSWVLTGVLLRHRRGAARDQQMSDPPIPYALRELDLAIDAYNTGNYEDAVQHGLSSFKGFDRLQDLDGRADVSRILGGAYLQTGDLANAHNFALGSLRDFERAKDDAGMGYALTLLGDIAQEKSLFEEANDYYRQALSHQALSHMEWSRDFWQIVVTSLNRANALQALGRDADANDMRARVQNLIEQPTARETPQRHVPLITRHTLSIRHAT